MINVNTSYVTNTYVTNKFRGRISFNNWTKNGKYFWSSIDDGPNVLAFIRIERNTWKIDILQAPKDTMGGDALNPEKGLITYSEDAAPWTADEGLNQMYREQWKSKGKKTHFYIYNLFTKKQTLLAKFDDPVWYPKPKWISDTELEYATPDGKIIYRINQQ